MSTKTYIRSFCLTLLLLVSAGANLAQVPDPGTAGLGMVQKLVQVPGSSLVRTADPANPSIAFPLCPLCGPVSLPSGSEELFA